MRRLQKRGAGAEVMAWPPRGRCAGFHPMLWVDVGNQAGVLNRGEAKSSVFPLREWSRNPSLPEV